MARYPDLADELREFFADHDRLVTLARSQFEATSNENAEPMPSNSSALSITRYMGNIARSIGWDGVLPLIGALVPMLVKTFLPNASVGTAFAVAVLLVIAALIRAQLGASQIARACGGEVPFLRQISLAAAIVVLLLFEAAVGIMTFSKDELSASGWWFPVAFYAVYVVVISVALWPRRDDD